MINDNENETENEKKKKKKKKKNRPGLSHGHKSVAYKKNVQIKTAVNVM